MSKPIHRKPIRMWIDGKCYNLKQYDQDKYMKLLEDCECGMKRSFFETIKLNFLAKNRKIESVIPIKYDTKPSMDAKSNKCF